MLGTVLAGRHQTHNTSVYLSSPLDPLVGHPLVPKPDRASKMVAPRVVFSDLVMVEPVEGGALDWLY